MIPCRWPLHPRPVTGESLSSWLERIGHGYGLTLNDLLEYDLGFSALTADDLDLNPPGELIERIATRTGIPATDVRALTFSGWVPHVFDRLDSQAGYFAHYVEAHSVLLPPGRRSVHEPTDWRPWFPARSRWQVQACRDCCATDPQPAVRLHWHLPLMVSCPTHDTMLEPILIFPAHGIHRPSEAAQQQASPAVRSMTRRTWTALTTGFVDLPKQRIQADVWFRLLRTILDELNTPITYVRGHKRMLMVIWSTAGFRLRAGQGLWKPFEILPEDEQRIFLITAATAMALIEARVIDPPGEDAALFIPPPSEHSDKLPDRREYPEPMIGKSSSCAERWAAVTAALEEAVAVARTDPQAARGLRNLLLFGRTDTETLHTVDAILDDLDIPLPEDAT